MIQPNRLVSSNAVRISSIDARPRLWLTKDAPAALKRPKAELTHLNARFLGGFTASEIDIVVRWLSTLPEKCPAIDRNAQ